MPMFEFDCRKCGAVFEELLSLAELEAGAVACPECGAADVARRLSSFASSTGSSSGAACGGGGCGGGGGFT